MKWKIVASPTTGQSSERQSRQPAATASSTFKPVTRLALLAKTGAATGGGFTPIGLRRLDVVAQRGGFVLHFLEPILHHVADRDHADHLVLLDHRNMPELAGRHPFHDDADGLRRTAGEDLACHDLCQRLRERGGTLLGEHADNVAFGQNADNPPVRAEHQQCPDLVLRERARGVCDRRRRLDRNHMAALGGENILDVHGSPPSTGCSGLRSAVSIMLDLPSSSVSRPVRPRRAINLRERDPLRGALDIERSAALTWTRLSACRPHAARRPPLGCHTRGSRDVVNKQPSSGLRLRSESGRMQQTPKDQPKTRRYAPAMQSIVRRRACPRRTRQTKY